MSNASRQNTVDGRFEIYFDGQFRAAVHGIRKAIQFARVFGEGAEVWDRHAEAVVWEPTQPWLWEFA